MLRKKLYFDDVFADIMLMHTLNHAAFKGAEIGECLAAASKVAEGNAESWQRAWQEQVEKAERAGSQADDRGHGISAREAYLRAVTYYSPGVGPAPPAGRATRRAAPRARQLSATSQTRRLPSPWYPAPAATAILRNITSPAVPQRPGGRGPGQCLPSGRRQIPQPEQVSTRDTTLSQRDAPPGQ